MSLLHHRFELNQLSIKFYSFVDPLTCVVWVPLKYFAFKYENNFFKLNEIYRENTDDICLLQLKWKRLIDNYPDDQIEVHSGWDTNAIMITQSSVSKILNAAKFNFCKLVDKWFQIICESIISECGYRCLNTFDETNAPQQYIYIASTDLYFKEDLYIVGTTSELNDNLKQSNFSRLALDKMFFVCVSELTPNYIEIMKVLKKRLEINTIIDGSIESMINNKSFYVNLKLPILYSVFREVCGSFKKV